SVPAQSVDFPSLFELHDTFHDAAVALLLEACRLLKIELVDWPKAAERFARDAALYPEGLKTRAGSKIAK
ncbi:hypothetical protein, partial [Thermogutta sp.]|uniref:hypothetical protein n=1 Tax=Thermogutta sp. TaxID=1962930 RepID=UPI0032208607